VNRRALLSASILTMPLGLIACRTTSTTGPATGTYTFAQVQAQIASLATAADDANQIMQSSTQPAAQKALSAQATAVVDAAASAVAALSAQPTGMDLLQTFVSGLQAIIPVLAPVLAVNPATAIALSLGLAIVQAFIGGQPIAAANMASVFATRVAGRTMPPVPVPQPTKSP
jgi:hypothetical protein